MLLRENILKKKAQFRQEIKSERNSILFGLKRAQYQSISQNPDQITFKDLLNNIKTLNVELFMNYIIDLKNQLSIYEWNSDKLLEMKKEGVLEYLIYMFRESKDRLQLDLAYILSNTLTGDSKITEYCIEKGLLDIFIELLKKNDFLIREQVLWGLANIAGDTEDILCLFFEKNVISQIKKTVFTFENTIEIRKTGSWLISNILRAKENIIGMKKGLNYEDLCSIIEILEKWLIEGDLDYENLENTLFCLNSIAKRFIHKTLITNIIQNHSSLIQKLNIIFQKTQKDQYIIHYLNFIGSLLTDNEDSETEILVSFGVIESLLCYHKHSSYRIRRSVYFSLGNILASNDTIVNHFCTFNSYFLPILLETIQNDTHFIVKKEAVVCLSNIINLASYDKINDFVNLGMLNIVFSLLDIYDPDLLILLLEILEETLKLGEFIMTEESSMENPFILDILKNKGVEKLEKLTQNQNNLISSKSSDIISRFLENIQETN